VIFDEVELTSLLARISDVVLAEAAHAVRHRLSHPNSPQIPGSCSPRVALRLVIFDCASVTWTGVRDILARNAECRNSNFKPELIQLKCFYGWQMTVDEHMKRVLRGDRESANRLENKWAEHMLASEDSGSGRRRRRRQAGQAWDNGDDFIMGVGGGRRSRRGASCVIC
jgi:F-box and leucine-rich repeat protein 2/20